MIDRERNAALAALGWYLDQGVDEALGDSLAQKISERTLSPPGRGQGEGVAAIAEFIPTTSPSVSVPSPNPLPGGERAISVLGKNDARAEAVKVAGQAATLEQLRDAIAAFDGIAIKKTATNLVFADGNPNAPVMLVGEAPGADEDRLGRPFVGVSGQLLDRILKWAGLDRAETDPAKAIYISNILNWRPPGNRTPSPAEIEVSLPFIEKHIALIRPKVLILCGGVSAKALLDSGESISRLRKMWHDYTPRTVELELDSSPIAALATYHPAYLLRTPSQKKAVWADMLAVTSKIKVL